MDKLKATTSHDFLTVALEKPCRFSELLLNFLCECGKEPVLVVKVLNINTLFLNYVLNELPSISKLKLVWRKFGGANDFDCPCGKA